MCTCVRFFWEIIAIPECIYCLYSVLMVFLISLVFNFKIRHKNLVQKLRQEDPTEVEALIQESKNIKPRLTDPERPKNFCNESQNVKKEVNRLKCMCHKKWTEFQVLTLDRMMVDFLPFEDLKARARASLDELKEYAYGEAFSYNTNFYHEWANRINSNIDELDKLDEDEKITVIIKDDKAEALRANLRAVYEHIADYQFKWAQGSTIVSSIRICGAASVIVFTLMGTLPLLYSVQSCTSLCDLRLNLLNWGFLGIAGALASTLVGLWNTEEVEVGNTEGKKELSRAILGVPLGLLAGMLAFSLIAGGVINGSIVPKLQGAELLNNTLSIVWAVGAGMCFERLFQQVRGTVGY